MSRNVKMSTFCKMTKALTIGICPTLPLPDLGEAESHPTKFLFFTHFGAFTYGPGPGPEVMGG